jgi:hypothetical protein
LPRLASSDSIASNCALKLPLPNPLRVAPLDQLEEHGDDRIRAIDSPHDRAEGTRLARPLPPRWR